MTFVWGGGGGGNFIDMFFFPFIVDGASVDEAVPQCMGENHEMFVISTLIQW